MLTPLTTAAFAINLLVTWGVFKLSSRLYSAYRKNSLLQPLFHPLIITGVTLIALLKYLGISTEQYQENSQFIMMMLAPATVALGVPLYKNLTVLVKYKYAIVLPMLLGAIISPCSAIFCLWIFEVDTALTLSMISKSITSPIAIDITKIVGGIPAIAVIFVIVSGIIGAAISAPLFTRLVIKHNISKGLALGVASHAIGTSSAIQISEECAAFSVLALSLNGLFTTLIIVIFSLT